MTNPLPVQPDEISYMADDDLVLGVYLNGEARAYPLRLGWNHEVINDKLNDHFISVSYGPLTGSGLNLEATATDGRQVEYGVSGFLLNSNLVIFDLEDNTLYPQMVFTGLNGARKGDQLKPLPVIETTWSLWKKMYPNTTVPKAGTGLGRFSAALQTAFAREGTYLGDPYGEYRVDDDDVPFPPPQGFDHRLRNKDIVMGICADEKNKVYPLDHMPDGAVINDQLGDLYHVVVFDSTSRTALTYNREFDGDVHYFFGVESESDLPIEFIDDVTGSRWNMRGEAVAGPAAGRRLEPVVTTNAMWFAWSGFFSRATIWAGEGALDVEITAIEEDPQRVLPVEFALSQNFPNPFNATTRLDYQLPHAGPVRLRLYNTLGQHVRTLVDEAGHAPGFHSSVWDGRAANGRDAASGEYLYRLEAPGSGFSRTRAMVLIR
jgi:hypothetical protein